MKVQAYVFVTTKQPRKAVQLMRKISGVVVADALVEGDDIAAMDTIIDRIVEVPEVLATDSKVARWID